MLKLCRVTKVKVFFLVLVYIIEFSTAILDKGLLACGKSKKKRVTLELDFEFDSKWTLDRIINPIQTGLFGQSVTGGGGGAPRTPPSVSLEPIMLGS